MHIKLDFIPTSKSGEAKGVCYFFTVGACFCVRSEPCAFFDVRIALNFLSVRHRYSNFTRWFHTKKKFRPTLYLLLPFPLFALSSRSLSRLHHQKQNRPALAGIIVASFISTFCLEYRDWNDLGRKAYNSSDFALALLTHAQSARLRGMYRCFVTPKYASVIWGILKQSWNSRAHGFFALRLVQLSKTVLEKSGY